MEYLPPAEISSFVSELRKQRQENESFCVGEASRTIRSMESKADLSRQNGDMKGADKYEQMRRHFLYKKGQRALAIVACDINLLVTHIAILEEITDVRTLVARCIELLKKPEGEFFDWVIGLHKKTSALPEYKDVHIPPVQNIIALCRTSFERELEDELRKAEEKTEENC